MERGRWEGQNFQPLKEVQCLEAEEEILKFHATIVIIVIMQNI